MKTTVYSNEWEMLARLTTFVNGERKENVIISTDLLDRLVSLATEVDGLRDVVDSLEEDLYDLRRENHFLEKEINNEW